MQFIVLSVWKSSQVPEKQSAGEAPQKKRDFLYKDTDSALLGKLSEAKAINEDAETLINQLFSDEKLGILVNKIFQELSEPRTLKERKKANLAHEPHTWLYDTKKEQWRGVPNLEQYSPKKGKKEYHLGSFLMRVAKQARKNNEKKLETERVLTSDFSGKAPVSYIGIQCMPDLIGVKKQYQLCGYVQKKKRRTRLCWENIDMIIKLKCGLNATTEKLSVDLTNKVFCTFQAQTDHQYVCCLGFMLFLVYFAVYDQSGLVRSKPFDINKIPIQFLRLVIGFMRGSDSAIGLDTVIMKGNETNGTIEVGQEKYDLNHVVWRADMIRRRGTTCFFERHCLAPYIIKDCWIIRG